MRIPYLVAVGAIAAVMLASTSASVAATGKTTHKWNSTLQEATLSTAGGYPNPGGTVFLAGALTARGLGVGADLDHSTITGHPTASVFTFKGKEVDFFAHGMERTSYAGTDTVQADGSQVIVDAARFTGGTGRYRGASGHYTFKGTIPPGSSVLTGHSTGSITY